jgi:hypothetical protein
MSLVGVIWQLIADLPLLARFACVACWLFWRSVGL